MKEPLALPNASSPPPPRKDSAHAAQPTATNGNGSSNGKGNGKFTGELVKRCRPQTYRNVIQLLAAGCSDREISLKCRVSTNTVVAIKLRESATIEEQKQDLSRRLLRITRESSEKVEDLLPRATLMQAATVMGIASDKALALSGSLPAMQVAIVNMPSEADREKQREIDAKLDAIARRLAERGPA